MANHVLNVITPSADFEKIKARVVTKENGEERFDFEKVVPMPNDIPRRSLTPEDLQEVGSRNWYHWRIAKWGTTWEAFDYSDDGTTFLFFTGWSHPHPVIEKLSRMFPEVTFRVAYAEEDLGQNVGRYTIKNGELVEHDDIEEGTKEAHQLAAELWGDEED